MSAALDRLYAIATPVPAPKVVGRWFNIRYSPSAAGGELFNVGVAYFDPQGEQVQARLIENLDVFGTLFGQHFEEDVRFTLDVVRSSLARKVLESPIRSVVFGEPRYAAGESVQEVLNGLFSTTVSFAEARPVQGRREPSPTNSAVRKSVFDAIRVKAKLSAEKIIAEDPILWARDGERRVPLEIPLQGRNRLGTVVSAGQRSKLPLENNLLRSSLDLETAARIFKRDRLGFFVMRPSDDSTDPVLDEVVDTTCWKLHKHGIHVGVEPTPERLAEDILGWSGV